MFILSVSLSQEFVDLYTDFLLNKHIECQFREFKLGFDMVTNDSSLTFWFTPEELDLLVCGSRVSPACGFFSHHLVLYLSFVYRFVTVVCFVTQPCFAAVVGANGDITIHF